MSKMGHIRESRPATYVTTARVDVRSLAVLARFWIEEGREPIRSISELLRVSLESLTDQIRKAYPLLDVESTIDACNIVQAHGLGDPRSKPKNRQSLLKQIAVEEMIADGSDPGYVVRRPATVAQTSDVSQEEIKEIVAQKMRELHGKKPAPACDTDARDAAVAHASRLVGPENGAESEPQRAERRVAELDAMKEGLACPPDPEDVE